MTRRRGKPSKKKEKSKGQVIIIPNSSLAENVDFMESLHDFQYGEGEVSERGFLGMMKHSTPKKK